MAPDLLKVRFDKFRGIAIRTYVLVKDLDSGDFLNYSQVGAVRAPVPAP